MKGTGVFDMWKREETARKGAGEEKAQPAALKDIELVFRNMINAFVVWESVLDDKGNFVSFRFGYFNDAYARIAKFTLDEVRGKDVFEVWPGTEKSWIKAYSEVALTGEPKTFEMYHEPTRGIYHCNAYRPGNTPDRVCVIFEDITERKRQEEAMRESEAKYRALVETTDTGFVIIDREGYVLDANREYARLTGHKSLEEILDRNVSEWTALHDSEKNLRAVQKCVTDGSVRNFRVDYVDGRGRFTPIEVNATLIESEKGARVVALCRDISDRAKAEEERAVLESQLLQSQKMESIGGLAGGIAHDFNNILTAIIGYASLLQMDMDGSDPRSAYLEQILSSSRKAADLTQSLLAFSRKQVMELKPVRVNGVVAEMEKILARLITEDIELNFACSAVDTMVMADSTQLCQVILNLATNARDAMPKGGKLIIGTKEAILDGEFQKAHGFGEPGRYAVVSVTDTGTGMDARTRGRIFEPFFTTKDVGRGTGLGLSMAYGIITQHNGYIDVISEPGVGTVFRIYLPAVENQDGEADEAWTEAARGGDETILVAEDNDELRGLVKEVLTRAGYTVIEARDGEEAVSLYEAHSEEVGLLILDVVMPGKGGKEVCEEVLRRKPHARVLFTSGYTGDVVLGQGHPGRSRGLHLQTPFPRRAAQESKRNPGQVGIPR